MAKWSVQKRSSSLCYNIWIDYYVFIQIYIKHRIFKYMILERPQNTNRKHQILENNCLHQLKWYKCKISNRYHSFLGFIVLDLKYNIDIKKVQNTQQIVYSGRMLRLVVLCVLYRSMRLFLYSPFYHGACITSLLCLQDIFFEYICYLYYNRY